MSSPPSGAPSVRAAVVARVKRVRKVFVRPVQRAAREAARSTAAGLGQVFLPPWRCPGCGGWKKARYLAPCAGVVDVSALRRSTSATGCPRCGLLYVTPFPPASDLRKLYSPGGGWATSHPQDTSDIAGTHLIEALDRIVGFRAPAPGSCVLDFGCGHGRWLNTFAEFGWTTFGIDPALKTAFTRHSELTAVGDSPRFQFVVASHVLEHVPNPGSILEQLGRATVPGGWIYVAVPHLDALPAHRDWKYVLSAGTHLAAYSLHCLTYLLAQSGFDAPVEIVVPKDRKGQFRLRIVARRGSPRPVAPEPLTSALVALRKAGVGTATAR